MQRRGYFRNERGIWSLGGGTQARLRSGWMVVLALLILTALGCSSGKMGRSESANDHRRDNYAVSESSAPQISSDKASALFSENIAPAAPPMTDSSSSGGFSGIAPIALPNQTVTATGLNLKMIYTANMTMEVEDYAKAQSEIRDMVLLSNGYILQFSDHQSAYERGGNFVIKVPAQGFMSFIDGLQQMKTVNPPRLSMQGQDVTEEYVDLSSRLKAKQVTEERLLAFMEKATATDDLVRFTQELGRVQEEIEQIKGRMRYLDQHVAFSTIEVRMYEKIGAVTTQGVDDQHPVWERAVKALKGSIVALTSLFSQLFIVIFAALPFLIVFGIVAAIGWIIYRRQAKKSRLPHHNKYAEENRALLEDRGNRGGSEESGESSNSEGNKK